MLHATTFIRKWYLIFRTVIPINLSAQDKAQDKIENKIIEFCKKEKSVFEIMSYIGHKNKTRFRRDYIKPLVDKGLLKMTIPEKPTSKYQKYISK